MSLLDVMTSLVDMGADPSHVLDAFVESEKERLKESEEEWKAEIDQILRCPCGGKPVPRHLTSGLHNILAVCPDCGRQYRLVYVPDKRDLSDIPQEVLCDYEVRG